MKSFMDGYDLEFKEYDMMYFWEERYTRTIKARTHSAVLNFVLCRNRKTSLIPSSKSPYSIHISLRECSVFQRNDFSNLLLETFKKNTLVFHHCNTFITTGISSMDDAYVFLKGNSTTIEKIASTILKKI